MNRSEKRKRYIFLALAYITLLTIPAAGLRIALARSFVTPRDLQKMLGESGCIVDRNGDVLYDGTGLSDTDSLGNLIGGTGMNPNTLADRYAEELLPGRIGLLSGIHNLEGKSFRRLDTTLLDSASQYAIAQAFGEKSGCCFAYNYVTGEIYTMLSLPSAIYDTGNAPNGALLNRCLDSVYVPGSTMKIVTAICALEQGLDLEREMVCSGETTLLDSHGTGHIFRCSYAHGEVDFSKALGVSCNGYFAGVIKELDVKRTQETLRTLGFFTNESAPRANLGLLSRKSSSVYFRDNENYEDIWGLIGQGKTTINLVDMTVLAAAASNGGKAAVPYLVADIYDPNTGKTVYEEKEQTKRLFSEETAAALEKYWGAAVEQYYRSGTIKCDTSIVYAKTGTAQKDNAPSDKLLLGICAEDSTAFMIVVENYSSGDPTPVEIANELVRYLPKETEK